MDLGAAGERNRMVAILERIKDRITSFRGSDDPPPQGMRDYEVTDEGCEEMRRRFADSFAGKKWNDVDRGVRRVAGR